MPETADFRVEAPDHVGFSVGSLDRALRFWTEVLGATIVRRTRMGGRFLAEVTGARNTDVQAAIIEVAGLRIELLEYAATPRRQGAPPAPFEAGIAHLAFTVSDLDEAIARSHRHGWRPQGEPQAIPEGPREGTRIMYVVGPDGETIEFMQPAA